MTAAGYGVSVICPKGPGEASFEELEGVRIHRYTAAAGGQGLRRLRRRVRLLLAAHRGRCRSRWPGPRASTPSRPATRPTPTGRWRCPTRPTGTRFVFDQHDLNPEVYASRFGKAEGMLYNGLLGRSSAPPTRWPTTSSRPTSRTATWRSAAGQQRADEVSVVRSGPDATTMVRGEPVARAAQGAQAPSVPTSGSWARRTGSTACCTRCAASLDAGRDDTHLALLGFGDCLDDLQGAVHRARPRRPRDLHRPGRPRRDPRLPLDGRPSGSRPTR